MMLLIISSTLGKREALPHVADATAATLRAVSESENSFYSVLHLLCAGPKARVEGEGPCQGWSALGSRQPHLCSIRPQPV